MQDIDGLDSWILAIGAIEKVKAEHGDTIEEVFDLKEESDTANRVINILAFTTLYQDSKISSRKYIEILKQLLEK